MAKPTQTFLLGTALKITSILSSDSPSSVSIKIVDPSFAEKASGSMTREAGDVYTYTYQSISTDLGGLYTATISVVYGSYTSVAQSSFMFAKQT